MEPSIHSSIQQLLMGCSLCQVPCWWFDSFVRSMGSQCSLVSAASEK